jgi:hypothetical protein
MRKRSRDYLCLADSLQKTLKLTPFNLIMVSNITTISCIIQFCHHALSENYSYIDKFIFQ